MQSSFFRAQTSGADTILCKIGIRNISRICWKRIHAAIWVKRRSLVNDERVLSRLVYMVLLVHRSGFRCLYFLAPCDFLLHGSRQ